MATIPNCIERLNEDLLIAIKPISFEAISREYYNTHILKFEMEAKEYFAEIEIEGADMSVGIMSESYYLQDTDNADLIAFNGVCDDLECLDVFDDFIYSLISKIGRYA